MSEYWLLLWYSFGMFRDKNNNAKEADTNLHRLGVLLLVLFGSSATGVKKPGDIDIAVFLTREAQVEALKEFRETLQN